VPRPTESLYDAVVIGSSAGGIKALASILAALPAEFPLPVIIAQHLHPDSGNHLPGIFNAKCELLVKQADERERIQAGTVYLAPPAYHLLIEDDHSFSLSLEAPVNYSRPSIDVLFECAARAYRGRLIGIILTGANHDGAAGLRRIKAAGGYAIVEDPRTAEVPTMPEAALAATAVDKVLPVQEIGVYLLQMLHRPERLRPASLHRSR